MRPLVATVAAVALIIAGAGQVSAHLEDIFFIVQFPDEAVPMIDGDLGDWEIVPSRYAITTDLIYDPSQRHEAGRGEIDRSNFNVRHLVGWNANAGGTGKLYFATEVFDNWHSATRDNPASVTGDESWEVNLNMDHTQQDEANQTVANALAWKFLPEVDGAFFAFRPGALKGLTWIVPGTEYTTYATTFSGDEFVDRTTYYELAVSPIESMPLDEATALDGMVMGELEDNKVIHIQIDNNDRDDNATSGNTIRGFWSTEPGPYSGEPNTDFVLTELDPQLLDALAATSVETDTWGRIKAQFR